jgi:hypothetical protein
VGEQRPGDVTDEDEPLRRVSSWLAVSGRVRERDP